tara:strand:+ start:296 stop:595 length:300 start_codon:yes stop_codon:yes gene_type:complete
MSIETPKPKTLDITFARMEDDEMDELFEQAVYDAAIALEEEPEYYDDYVDEEPTEATTDFVEYVASFDPDYDHTGDNGLDPEQCRYGTDFDSIWRGNNG